MIGSKRMSRFTKNASALIWTLCLLLPSMMRAQGASIWGQALSSTGKPAAFATVRVCPYSGGGIPCSPLSNVYSDLALTQQVPNPYTSDNFGNFSIFVSSQTTYIVQLNVGSGTTYSYLVTVGGIGGGFTAGKDLSGTSTSQTVIGIQGHLVAATAPTNGQVLEWNSTSNEYVPTTPTSAGITALTGPVTATGPGSAVSTITPTGVTAGNYTLGSQVVTVAASGQITSIGNPFAMSISCTAAGTFEIGYATTNPNVCSLGYSNGTPASATVTDGTHTNTLTSPFTTSSQAFSYTSNTTFTGNATATNTQTASAATSFAVEYCTFSGVGTGGTATGATASGSGTGNQCASETATLTGATATLSSNGLGNTFAGQTFTLTPFDQNIYLVLTGGCGHTLTVNSFTTVFTTQAFTYTNILGGSQTGMCAYTSPTNYRGTYIVGVSAL